MSRPIRRGRYRARGFVLVASLLLLVVVTLLGLAMFRSFGLEDKIGSNVREKQRALQAAEAAEQFAEFWLTSGTNASSTVITCAALVNANTGGGQICTNQLSASVPSVTQVPWTIAGVNVGVTYTPPGMTINTTPGQNTNFATPVFYIASLGQGADKLGTVFRIDAVGYGGSPDAIAVVESTYEVGAGVKCIGGNNCH